MSTDIFMVVSEGRQASGELVWAASCYGQRQHNRNGNEKLQGDSKKTRSTKD